MNAPMKLGLVLAPLFVATTAYAQAPGEYEEGTGAPGMAPVVVAPTPPPQPLRRWSIGLGVGSMDLAPHNAPDAKSHYSIGQLAVRYRATRHLELELALGGGDEKVGEGKEQYTTGMQVSQAVLALRYRFNPHRPWNFWVMAGMGSLAVHHEEASDEEREAAQQSTLQFGAGLERRWTRFALQLELRAVGVKPHEADAMTTVQTDPGRPNADGSMTPPKEPVPPPDSTVYADDGKAGGQMVLSANYYF
jgi:hypothetical protein